MLLLNFLHIRHIVSETRTFPLYSDGRYAHCSEIVLKIYDSCLIQLPYNSNLIHEWSRLERWYYVPSHTDILPGFKEYQCNIVISNRPPYAYAFSAVNILQKPFNISRYILPYIRTNIFTCPMPKYKRRNSGKGTDQCGIYNHSNNEPEYGQNQRQKQQINKYILTQQVRGNVLDWT